MQTPRSSTAQTPSAAPAAMPRGDARRVCMVVFMTYPQDPRVRREAAALARAGYEVDVLCLRGPGQPREEVCEGVRALRIMAVPRDKERLSRYLLHTLAFTLKALAAVTVRSHRRGYRLYQVHTMPDFLIFSCLAARLGGRPVILDLHDLSVELFESKLAGARRSLMRLVAWQERVACAFADHLITTSEGFRARLLARGQPADKITLVLNAADPLIFQYHAERRFEPIGADLRLLYHGTVAHRFGLHEAISALTLIRARHPGVRLAIHGKYDPAYRRSLEAQAARLGVTDCVHFGDWLTPAQLVAALRAADLAVVPYLRDAFMELAISTKTLEYAATGLPAVASRLHSMTSLFGDDAVTYVEPGDHRALAAAVLALAADPETRRRQSLAACEAQSRCSGAVMAERYTRLVSALMDGRAPPDACPLGTGQETS